MSDKSSVQLVVRAFQNINRLTFPTLAGRLNRIDSLVYGTDRKLIKLWSPPNGLDPATQIKFVSNLCRSLKNLLGKVGTSQ